MRIPNLDPFVLNQSFAVGLRYWLIKKLIGKDVSVIANMKVATDVRIDGSLCEIVPDEKGNFDKLLCIDVDFRLPADRILTIAKRGAA